MSEIDVKIPQLDEAAMEEARNRHEKLTKPQGSLGKLEEWSVRIAGMKASGTPQIEDKVVVTMAGDHGVTDEKVSAYPSEVTREMVANMADGGAAVNALSDVAGAENLVVDMGVDADILKKNVIGAKIGYGTSNIADGEAMPRHEAVEAIKEGRRVFREYLEDADIIGLGDMGIGNTTPSAAITGAITEYEPSEVVGRGTGVSDETLKRKIGVVEKSIESSDFGSDDGIDVLSSLGGYEIGGLAGLALESASQRVPVVVDGFITGAACLIASEIDQGVNNYLLPSHSSAEKGHGIQLEYLGLEKLFDYGMRLGEGTGACLALPVYEGACEALSEMSTFEEADVSNS